MVSYLPSLWKVSYLFSTIFVRLICYGAGYWKEDKVPLEVLGERNVLEARFVLNRFFTDGFYFNNMASRYR